ncbi:MAG TPA: hypothetical protein PKK00_06435 [Bacteroidales bacterium]|nr:hypothetical protein [Bacteroidales bacterium]HPS16927.1 hypothetical protein [Bacteroidales bacterium]
MNKNTVLRLLTLFSLYLIAGKCASQDSTAFYRRSSIYFEIGGNACSYSINYEWILTHNIQNNFSARGGINYLAGYMGCIIMTNYFWGKKHNLFELGAGLYRHWNKNDLDNTFTMTVGYRYQKNGLLFKLGFTPLFDVAFDRKQFIKPMIGLGLGYALKTKRIIQND